VNVGEGGMLEIKKDGFLFSILVAQIF